MSARTTRPSSIVMGTSQSIRIPSRTSLLNSAMLAPSTAGLGRAPLYHRALPGTSWRSPHRVELGLAEVPGMLSRDDNELLTRVGPDTGMGALLRRYWIPVLRSPELEPGGRVKRVMLLGERLIAYRALDGRAGLIAEFCPHRGASLYFGRVEQSGMRCVYHGWKFGLDGQCLEMPNEPRESAFAAKICQTAYPCSERGGVIWAYMGPDSPPPPLPDLEWTLLPQPHVFISKRVQECNWFQALEGGIDSSHLSFLHAPLRADDQETVPSSTGRASAWGRPCRRPTRRRASTSP